jgi:hypothetical protein
MGVLKGRRGDRTLLGFERRLGVLVLFGSLLASFAAPTVSAADEVDEEAPPESVADESEVGGGAEGAWSPEQILAEYGLVEGGRDYWDTPPETDQAENRGFMPYWQIGPRLREIELESDRVQVEVMGQSVLGRNLLLVTVSSPDESGELIGRYAAIRNLMLRDPDRALARADLWQDFKVPIFVNGSIHGNEEPGVDAIMRLIERLAFDDDPETLDVLENTILFFNVVQNPDGRVAGTRANANGFDLNRDFITQSQPETRATVRFLAEWNPMVVLDLHGFVNPMLIEPCTPPHNNNYEYDLYIKWALGQAQAMKAALASELGYNAQIPFTDRQEGWDDWPPIYTPMYAMYHGAYGSTLETPFRDARGVNAHATAVWAAFRYAAENRLGMISDQIEMFRRGYLDMDQVSIVDQWGQRHDYLAEFPTAYVIPVGTGQRSDAEAVRLANHLLFNGVEVQRAAQAFQVDGPAGSWYDAGSFLVFMNQPKRGLANTILGPGWDISARVATLYSPPAAWSQGLLWGADVVTVERDVTFAPKAVPVGQAKAVGQVDGGRAVEYALPPTSTAAVRATNELLADGVALTRTTAAFEAGSTTLPPGTVLIPATEKSQLNTFAAQYGLRFHTVTQPPTQREALEPLRVAAALSVQERWVLNRLGFNVTPVTAATINSTAANPLQDIDVLIASSNLWSSLNTGTGRPRLTAFHRAGGGLVGIESGGANLANQSGVFTPLAFSSAGAASGIVRLTYDQTSPVVGSYPATDTAKVDAPVWFTTVPTQATTAGRLLPLNEFFVAGHWRNRPTSAGQGRVVIHGDGSGTLSDARVALFGIDPFYQGLPERSWPAVSNALYWASADS